MTREHKRKLIVGLILIGVVVMLYVSGIWKYVSLESIKSNRRVLQKMIEAHYWRFVLGFIGIFIAGSAASLPISVPMSLMGGFFFGTVYGALFANVAATIGSTISFLLIHHLFGKVLHARYKDRLSAFNREFKRYGYSYLLSIHFLMVVPLFVANILAGLANVSLWTFIWTTSVGIIPGTILFAFAGKQLMTIDSWSEVFSVSIILVLGILFLLSLTPLIIRWIRFKRTGVKPLV